ncbi:uncharacterized protein LOC120084680 [Benincasa hispida]|uniref:uncharacterized protein LOC120084680 n=1 Tax=Benincasa hispida TaxID=102211 RepID=UPI0019015E31|nr:uncharacterized protein LOC120084680 [Benincasa hispida]
MEDRVFDRITQRLAASVGSIQNDPEKKFGIERLKALGATTFDGTTDPLDAEIWLGLIEKCFKVMRCPEDCKVELATFLLQKGVEKWWKLVETAIRVEGSVTKEDELQPREGQFRVLEKTRSEKFRSSFSGQSRIRSFGGMSQQSLSRKKSRPVAKQSGRSVSGHASESVASTGRKPLCVNCGKPHTGVCYGNRNVCFQCRQAGHFRRDFPQLSHGTQNEQRQGTQMVNQPRTTETIGEGSSVAKQKGVAGRPQ